MNLNWNTPKIGTTQALLKRARKCKIDFKIDYLPAKYNVKSRHAVGKPGFVGRTPIQLKKTKTIRLHFWSRAFNDL